MREPRRPHSRTIAPTPIEYDSVATSSPLRAALRLKALHANRVDSQLGCPLDEEPTPVALGGRTPAPGARPNAATVVGRGGDHRATRITRREPLSLLERSRTELVRTRAVKGLLGPIRTIAFREPPGKSGGRGPGVRERCCKCLSVRRAHEQLPTGALHLPVHASYARAEPRVNACDVGHTRRHAGHHRRTGGACPRNRHPDGFRGARHVHYFPQEGHAGFRCLGGEGLPEDGRTRLVYQGCDPPSGEEIPNEFVVPQAAAVQAARDFFQSPQRSISLSWLEL
jgi:hypothetical protein